MGSKQKQRQIHSSIHTTSRSTMFQVARRFLSTGRPLQTKWPNRKPKLTAYEQHNFEGAVATEKIMPKGHFVMSMLLISVCGWAFPQYIMSTQALRVKKKKAEIEI